MELDQAGPAKVARDENHMLVALKAIDFPPETLQLFEAENVVNLMDVFRNSGQTFLVYEFTCVSLRQIQGTSRGLQIEPFEIAAICKEHDFLPKESLQELCLKELVLVAQVSAMHDWEIYTKERIDQDG
ncbi:MAG: hypothetical protein L6R40_008283 [Gallowayella cf. fulva]|nr:MAG: hypothetical protein L6R40_008283 [Xanthomendoza cf. fulva]